MRDPIRSRVRAALQQAAAAARPEGEIDAAELIPSLVLLGATVASSLAPLLRWLSAAVVSKR